MSDERKSFAEKMKKVSPKRALYAFSFLFMLALIALMTFATWIIDPEHFNFFSWLTNTLILIGIQIPSIIIGELSCKDRQQTNPDGKYQASLSRFADTEKGVVGGKQLKKTFSESKQYFSQWFFKFRNEENFRKKVSYLMSKEIDGQVAERIVRYYDSSDLPLMSKQAMSKQDEKGNEIKESRIGRLREDQIPYVREVFEGKVNIKENSYAYYLSADSDKGAGYSILEEGPRIEREERKLTTRNRVTKVLSHIVFSAIFAMITVDAVSDAGNIQTWVNLVSRLSSMVAGLTSGWMTSVAAVKLEASVIEKKCIVREDFLLDLESGSFKPKAYDELVAEELKKQEEERKASVAEVVDTITPKATLILGIGDNGGV